MIYKISFSDNVTVSVNTDTEEIVVESFSTQDVEFNNIANKAMLGDETNYFRLINLINLRAGEEIL